MTKIGSLTCVVCLLAVGCSDVGDAHYGGRYDEGGGYYDTSTGAPPPSSAADAGAGRPAGDEGELNDPGDRFENVGTNPFVVVDHDPFSTFAADVDTASYDIFVRDVEDGLLPAENSVRLEEYVNSFEYDYAAPAFGDEVPFAIDLAATQHAMDRRIAQVRVGIQAATPPEFEKKETNLVYLVDVSGSMGSDDKLPLAKLLIELSLEVLDETDTVSIVTYSGDVRVALGPTNATERDTILAAVRTLNAGGSTAGGAAMDLAYDQARAGYIEDGFNHVIMMTDGDFNVGISSDEALVALIEEKRRTGVTLTALGFGRGNLNDAMMERVSNAGNGTYSVITSARHAREYAGESLLAGINLVAQDMKIQVEFNPAHVVAYRLLGYENRAIADEDFRDDTVDAGEVGAGHQVTALYEVVLTGQSIPHVLGAPDPDTGDPVEGDREIAPDEFIQVRVRWKDLGATESDPAYETAAALYPGDVAQMIETADRNLQWAAAVAAFAEIVKASPYALYDDLERVESIIAEQATRDDDRQRFYELFQTAREMYPPPAMSTPDAPPPMDGPRMP